MFRRGFVVWAALVAVTGGACSGGHDIGDDAALGESRFGLLSITHEHDWSNGESQLLWTAHAQFVRFTAMDKKRVHRLLAMPLDPKRDLPPLDTCKTYDLTLDVDAAPAGEGHVELLEAGELQVKTATNTVSLRARHFPGLLPFVSGVVYGEVQSAEEDRVGPVSFTSGGGESVGEFSVEAQSPALPDLLRVGNAVAGQSAAHDGGDLPLRWQTRAGPSELTYLEIQFPKAERELVLRCRPRDDGAFDVPAAQLAELAPDRRLALEMVRVRQVEFGASGLHRAELRVTVRQRATVLFQ